MTIEAVVTGAASGIGRACADRLQREGVAVLAGDRNGPGLEDFRARGVATLVADLKSQSERDRVVGAAAGARFLVNAAGGSGLRPILQSGGADQPGIHPANRHALLDPTSPLGRAVPPT